MVIGAEKVGKADIIEALFPSKKEN